ncbi:TPA: thioredoxin fold domain-containing protein [Salmonella enterica subsp. salamae serovar 35:g,m,s,t:-]|nr:thioredoxin fold domain-containing protein [Salmonella enterica subsp. salamae serovar 35:g,m,s,t:-]HCA3549689.1 thioredoxin fold domain-containing protein [Salmonella enterica subsp. salamae serovar 35:g,m,s,t:-]
MNMFTEDRDEFTQSYFNGGLGIQHEGQITFINVNEIVSVTYDFFHTVTFLNRSGKETQVKFTKRERAKGCYDISVRNMHRQKNTKFYFIPIAIIACSLLWLGASSQFSESRDQRYSTDYLPEAHSSGLLSYSDSDSLYHHHNVAGPVRRPNENGADINRIANTESNAQNLTIIQHPMHISRKDLSTILAKAATTGRYSIKLNTQQSPEAKTLYVFADPNCPHCREIEPTLAALANDYNVEIFPVAVIGNAEDIEQGKIESATALCSADKAHTWVQKVNKSEIPPGEVNNCAVGSAAVNTNNKIFNIAGFNGTPTLINSNGEAFPDSTAFTRESIANWLDFGGAK